MYRPVLPIPSGNTTQAAHQYYNYLWSVYLGSIPPDRTKILWSGPIYVFIFTFVLVFLFFLYTRYANRVHRTKGEMYGIMSFAGSILERIGPLSAFEVAFDLIIFAWAVYLIVIQVLNGYVYINVVH